MNRPKENKPEGMDLGFILWAIWNLVFFTLVWRARHILPLWWPGSNPIGKLVLIGGMLGIGALYVWWANRRDFK
jgi:hypothetical protein